MFTNKYPYTDFHELNLDWVLSHIRELASQMEGWQAANTIRYQGDWNITKQYPAWSVVVDNGAGYISKKPVPAGIAIDNTDYWENIADFSALYADLGNRMDAAEADIDALQLSSWLYGKKVAWFGDSVAHILIPKFTAKYPGTTITDYSYNGEPLAKLNAGFDTCGYVRLMAANLSSYDYVFIQYGVNDWQGSVSIDNEDHDEYTFGGALKKVLDHIKTSYPSCIPVVITPTWVNRIFSAVGRINNVFGSIEGYINHAIDICNACNVSYINMYTITGINEDNYTTLLRDDVDHVVYVHPTDYTADIMNRAIQQHVVNTGHCFGEIWGGNHAGNIVGSLVPSVAEYTGATYLPCLKYGGNLSSDTTLNLVNTEDDELIFKVAGHFNDTGDNAPIMKIATYDEDFTQIQNIAVAVIAAGKTASYFEMYFKMQKAKYFKIWYINIPDSPYMIIEGYSIQLMNGTADVYSEIVKLNPVADVTLSASSPNPKIVIKNGMINLESIVLDIGDNFAAGSKIASLPNIFPVNQYSIAVKGSADAHWINFNGNGLYTVTSLANNDFVTIPAQVLPLRTHDTN